MSCCTHTPRIASEEQTSHLPGAVFSVGIERDRYDYESIWRGGGVMNYYPHHIGDFNSATRHLTRVERSLYRDLIELYYDTEQPLPADDFDRLARHVIATSEEEKEALRYVLGEFFTLDDGVYCNSRCDAEISKHYRNKKNHWGNNLTKAQRCEIQAARNAARLKATPNWLTSEQRKSIRNAYAQSSFKTAKTGVPHEVDHIVPLRGKLVCGLHVPWNLRVIEAYRNRQKSNIWEVS